MTQRPPHGHDPGLLDRYYRPKPLTPDQAVGRAIATTDRCEPLQRLLRDAAPTRGRPRKIALDVIARCVMVHSILVPESQAMTRITDTLWTTLSPSQRFNLGLHQVDPTYARVRSSILALVRLLDQVRLLGQQPSAATYEHPEVDARTGDVADCQSGDGRPPVTLDELACALLNAAIPNSVATTGSMAIDGTDIETCAHAPYGTADDDRPACWDPDARFGHRTSTTNHPGDLYLGYAAHLATDIPAIGAPPVSHLARGLVLRPANHASAAAGIDLLTIMQLDHGVTECVADRGYTMATAEHFAEPAHQLGISIDMDLHTYQQTQHPGPKPGTLWVDGTLYSTALPERLHHIAAPSLTQTAAEKAALRDLFDKRRPYEMRPLTTPTADGVQRPRGPARRGRLRCPNVPKSMRAPHTTPLTGCTRDQPCGCGLTVTVHRHEHQRDRQRLPWQSTAWFDSYGRRVGIESLNASVRGHHANINRGYIRVVGLAPVTTLLAFGLAGMNTRILNAWYTSRGQPEPWAVALTEPPDERVPQRQHRRYCPKRGSPPATPGGYTKKRRKASTM